MIELRKELNKILKTINSRVYYQYADDKAQYPYIVYDLPNSFLNEDQEVFNLDVDVWDRPIDKDTTEIESMADAVWNTLHKHRFIDSNMQVSIYRQNRLSISDDNPKIRRRKMIFELKYFDRR